jgi:branched-chain amino acid transport system ATP-binding protein
MNEQETEALGKSLEWVHREADCALLVIDHDLKFIMTLCERVTVMNMGEILAKGSPSEIVKNKRVVEAYIGQEAGTAA